MGVMTLADFRSELNDVVGDRAVVAAARVNRWINFGYLDVTGAVEFAELEELPTVNTAIGTESYAVPADARAVLGVMTPDKMLGWMPKHEWMRIRNSTTGAPIRWTRLGNQLKISPIPSSVMTLTLLIKKEAAALALDTDVTVLPDTWDLAIHYLSVSHAWYALKELASGTAWLNRAISYIQTRAIEEHRELIEPGLGATLTPSIQQMAEAVAPTSGFNPQG
jgi:hypothetical protein